MTGGEIFAAGKAVEAIGKKALVEDEKTRDFLLRVAEGTPEMMAAARGIAARIAVKERVKLKLYQPFARMLGVSMAYFEDTFPQEMGAKIADIPDENLVTPPASIAVPALQGLSYTFEEGSLKELYLNLLATASDNRRANQAHPAFAEIIKQLAPDEAKLLREVLPRRHLPIARIMDEIGRPKGAFDLLMSYLLPIVDATGRAVGGAAAYRRGSIIGSVWVSWTLLMTSTFLLKTRTTGFRRVRSMSGSPEEPRSPTSCSTKD